MDIASYALSKKYTNEQVIQKATNSPVETLSFDGGIYSLPSNVVNGQVSDVRIKGQTWTNLAGAGDTSPQTVENLDAAKTYLLINSEGANVTIDTVDTPTPVKLTGATSFDFGWASGEIALYELSTEEATLEASVLGQKYHYVSGTKSTVSAIRLRSVSEDESQESIAYLPDVGELRSLPNGVKDEVSVSDGKATQNVSDEVVLQGSNFKHFMTNSINNDIVSVDGSIFVDIINPGTDTIATKAWTSRTAPRNGASFDSENNVWTHSFDANNSMLIFLPKGLYADLDSVREDLAGTTLIYQLATPIVTNLPAQAPLQVFENGTVYVEPIGDPAETTVPSVEMTIPIGTSNKFGVASHDYDGAAADWVLTNSESKCFLLAVSNAGGSANIIAPDAPGVMYAISNDSGQTVTVKISGGSGVEVVDSKTVLVIHNGTDYTALTAEL